MPAPKTDRRADHPAEGFHTLHVPAAPRQPARVYLPTDYQAKYAYPLVVLFHADGESEESAARLVPQLSRRNYVALCLRGAVDLGTRADGRPAFGWGDAATDRGVKAALARVRAEYSVHPGRVFLVGVGEGAAAACQLGLALGDRAAGVVALNGALPTGRIPANNLRVLVSHGTANPVVPFKDARRAAERLTRAGATVRVARYDRAHRVGPDMLADANRWIMAQITTRSLVTGH